MKYKYAGAPEHYEMGADQEKLMMDLMDMDGTDVSVVELTYDPTGVVEIKHLSQFRKNPYDLMWVEEVTQMFPNFVRSLQVYDVNG